MKGWHAFIHAKLVVLHGGIKRFSDCTAQRVDQGAVN
jgi:hypothetical protein